MGCPLASIAVHLTVDRGVHLVSDLVPAITADALRTFQIASFASVIVSLLAALAAPLNIVLSGYLIIRIPIELIAEFGWLFAAAFLPREQSDYRKHPLGQQYARERRPQSVSRNTKNEIAKRLSGTTNRARSFLLCKKSLRPDSQA
jgi:hypothetical protein